MLTRDEYIAGERLQKELSYLSVKSPLFLDIETTGLSSYRAHIYLLGTLAEEPDGWHLRQWFLDRPYAEKELLEAFAEYLKTYAGYTPAHYNGDSFDLPFLRQKYRFYGLPVPDVLSETVSGADLLRMLRPCRRMLGLKSLRLPVVEAFLKDAREDTASGRELIDVYTRFLETGDASLLDALFLHNRDDVRALVSLLPVLAYAAFSDGVFVLTDTTLTDSALQIRLCTRLPFPVERSISENGYSLILKDSEALLEIPVYTGELKHFYPDYRNYVYLPLEDQAVHRSVGMFVDRAHREMARASTCYQRVQGRFLPASAETDQPLFYAAYRRGPAYFRPDEAWLSDPQAIAAYARSVIAGI